MQASAAVPKNAHFVIGHGEHADIAVAGDGTAHVAWVHESTPGVTDQIQYCRVPRGKRACVGLHTFELPGQAIGERPYVFLPGGSTVLVLSHRCCFSSVEAAASELTEVLRSTDGGQTFGPPQLVGTYSAQGDAQLGPNGTVYTIDDIVTGGVNVQRGALDGSAPELARQHAHLGGDEFGGTLAVLPDGSVLAAHYDGGSGAWTMHVSRFSGVGDPNTDAAWSTVFTSAASNSPKTGGQQTELASGKKGVFLFSTDDEVFTRFQVRKWNGSTFGAPTFITPAGQDNIFPSFWEDASGRTAVAYSDGQRKLLYRASDLKGFAVTESLSAGANLYHLRGATAADGGGFVAYDENSGTGLVSLAPIPVRRTIAESVKGSVLSGTVAPFRVHQLVALQKSTSHGWVTTKTVGLNAKGHFAFTLPAGKAKWRAAALASEGYGEADGKPISKS